MTVTLGFEKNNMRLPSGIDSKMFWIINPSRHRVLNIGRGTTSINSVGTHTGNDSTGAVVVPYLVVYFYILLTRLLSIFAVGCGIYDFAGIPFIMVKQYIARTTRYTDFYR